ncbi:MAG: nuclear transport factor 2 family protein [Alphaproteobacteria bacterium]|nr:nuclear transport factor 2 family protein [Alphaproteobacteria bacterium]
MRPLLAAIALAAELLLGTATRAAPADDARGLYERFYAAQNARDLATVRALFLDSPRFLWVSDGQSVWGRDAVLARMASFQEYAVWRVAPELDRATAVELNADSAYLHLPLALTLGESAPRADTYRFLVSMLCVRTDAGWRIAALFTTREKEG